MSKKTVSDLGAKLSLQEFENAVRARIRRDTDEMSDRIGLLETSNRRVRKWAVALLVVQCVLTIVLFTFILRVYRSAESVSVRARETALAADQVKVRDEEFRGKVEAAENTLKSLNELQKTLEDRLKTEAQGLLTAAQTKLLEFNATAERIQPLRQKLEASLALVEAAEQKWTFTSEYKDKVRDTGVDLRKLAELLQSGVLASDPRFAEVVERIQKRWPI